MSKIPSEEDFARADRLMSERMRGLDAASKNTTEHFRKICPLFKVHMFWEADKKFRACVFFYKDKDIQECKRNGMAQAIEDFVYAELERQGRGKREDITIVFEFDSDENVKANYEGDYFLRLR